MPVSTSGGEYGPVSTLQLKAQKTELVWFGSAANIREMSVKNLTLGRRWRHHASGSGARPRRLSWCCWADNETSCQPHEQLFLSAPPTSSDQTCRRSRRHKTVLICHKRRTLLPLQLRALNAASRLVANLGSRDHIHITPVMKELHWLPINQLAHHIQAVSNDAYHSHAAVSWIHACRWQLPLPRVDFVRSAASAMASRTVSQGSERSSVNVLSAIPDLLRGTRQLSLHFQAST